MSIQILIKINVNWELYAIWVHVRDVPSHFLKGPWKSETTEHKRHRALITIIDTRKLMSKNVRHHIENGTDARLRIVDSSPYMYHVCLSVHEEYIRHGQTND